MSVFSKIKEAFVKSEDKDKYLSGLDRSKKSFGDRMRALSNNFHGIDDDLLEWLFYLRVMWVFIQHKKLWMRLNPMENMLKIMILC